MKLNREQLHPSNETWEALLSWYLGTCISKAANDSSQWMIGLLTCDIRLHPSHCYLQSLMISVGGGVGVVPSQPGMNHRDSGSFMYSKPFNPL